MFQTEVKVRLDKWLWAARFYKTRSLATQAIDRGKVRVNGDSVKPARELKGGELLHIAHADTHLEVYVRGVSDIRQGAPQARLLYEETVHSIQTREAAAMQRRLAPEPSAQLHGRPSKKQRRDMTAFRHS